MVVWGGQNTSGTYISSGGRYNPSTDSWVPTSTVGAPTTGETGVWTGSEMIVWGGHAYGIGDINTGGRYTPSTDSWVATSVTNAPPGRIHYTAVWAGTEMIIWGGEDSDTGMVLNSGGRYFP
jgi:N-acetylneuraminic acid mutarotase